MLKIYTNLSLSTPSIGFMKVAAQPMRISFQFVCLADRRLYYCSSMGAQPKLLVLFTCSECKMVMHNSGYPDARSQCSAKYTVPASWVGFRSHKCCCISTPPVAFGSTVPHQDIFQGRRSLDQQHPVGHFFPAYESGVESKSQAFAGILIYASSVFHMGPPYQLNLVLLDLHAKNRVGATTLGFLLLFLYNNAISKSYFY